MVGSIGVAVVGVLGVVWQQRQTEKVRLREVHRDRMSPVYDDLLGVMWGKLAGAQEDKIDPQVEEFFRDLKARQLMLGASSAMVQGRRRDRALLKRDQPLSSPPELAAEHLVAAFELLDGGSCN